MIEKKIEQLSKENCCRAEGFIDGLLASQGDVERTKQRMVENLKLISWNDRPICFEMLFPVV